MTFNKEAYWAARNADEKPAKPKKNIVTPKGELSFDDNGQLIVKNRQFRRRKIKAELTPENKPKNTRKRK